MISFTTYNYLKTLIVILPNCILNYTVLYLEVLARHTLDSNPESATATVHSSSRLACVTSHDYDFDESLFRYNSITSTARRAW